MVTRQNRDRHKPGTTKPRDKLTLVVDNVESCVKSPQILHVLVHIILGDSPEILDMHYEIQPDTDHVTEFHGDRPRELGDPVKPPQLK